jgi:hypothetical protein
MPRFYYLYLLVLLPVISVHAQRFGSWTSNYSLLLFPLIIVAIRNGTAVGLESSKEDPNDLTS